MRNLIIIILLVLVVGGIIYFLTRPSKRAQTKKTPQTESVASKPAEVNEQEVASTSLSISATHAEWPAVSDTGSVVSYTGFSLLYDETHEQARWVAYELTQEETGNGVERSNHFMEDPHIATQSATNADYAKSGYDRGHLAPASDMGWSATSMEESFYFSNMSPQNPSFNRGIWKKLETQVRNWASEHESIYVVTGPILTDGLPTIGPNKVSVPAYYYKVIVDINKPEMHGIGFILPNAASKSPLSDFAVTIDSVEKVTGLDFFHSITVPLIDDLERQNCYTCW
jgi:endonuclease G